MSDNSPHQDPPSEGDRPLQDDQLFQILQKELKGAAVKLAARSSPGGTFRATELLQEVFLRTKRRRNEWGDENELTRYAFRVMFNLLIDRAKKRRPERQSDEELEGRPSRPGSDLNDLFTLNEVLTELDRDPTKAKWSEVYKAYCFLTFQFRFSQDGLEMLAEAAPGEYRTFEEIGRIVGLPTSSAHLCYQKACMWLQTRLRNSYPERVREQ